MNNMKVLLVEDDIGITNALVDCLEYVGAQVSVTNSGGKAVGLIKSTSPDFVILDLMLPEKNGLTICKQVREFSDVPIMMLTARINEVDRLKGLKVGADDYVCKPFFPKEIIARIKAIMRRLKLPTINYEKEALIYKSITLDEIRYLCKVDDKKVDLTVIEFNLLKTMVSHPGVVFSRENLITEAYSSNKNVNSRTVDNHVKNLRRKLLEASGGLVLIHSVYRAGYKVE